jgi:tetraacyldisaccharide 4'-kinase
LVSGGGGPGAAFARGALRVAEVPYTWAITWRNRAYDRNPAKAIRVDVPVISVGNITLGGTGKTPMVEWLARWFVSRGVRVAIVSRGYGAKHGQKNDEALELERSLPSVPHEQNPDRVAGARAAVERHASELIVLDDGFQHRRLARDLDMVLLDATEPFGFEHVFPRGLLREPLDALQRADVVCLTRADLLDKAGREAIRQRVAALAPQAAWCEAAHVPMGLRNTGGHAEPLSALGGRRIAAFCGVGNPAAFRRSLEGLGAEVVFWRAFPDHRAYTTSDQAELARAAAAYGAEMTVTTIKDLVKLPMDELGCRPLWALAIELELRRGREELELRLDRVLRATTS